MSKKRNEILLKLDRADTRLGRLMEQLESLSTDQLSKAPAPGQWSVLQIMQHLIISETGSLGYVKKKLSFQPKLEHAGISDWFRRKLLQFYIWAPIKFKAPEVVNVDTKPLTAGFPELKQQWLGFRQELRLYLQQMPETLLDKSIYKHPLGGRLSILGMVEFFDGHFRRHQHQIKRTLERVGKLRG